MKLHSFNAFTAFHSKIMYKICCEKKTTFHRLFYKLFRFFSQPGYRGKPEIKVSVSNSKLSFK